MAQAGSVGGREADKKTSLQNPVCGQSAGAILKGDMCSLMGKGESDPSHDRNSIRQPQGNYAEIYLTVGPR